MLALLELVVFRRVVGVAGAEEGGAVVGEGFELAFGGVDVGFEIAEAGVDAGAGGGGDVLFFNAHHVELECFQQIYSMMAGAAWVYVGGEDVLIHWLLQVSALLIVLLIFWARRIILLFDRASD